VVSVSEPRHDNAPGCGTEGEANTQESLKALTSLSPALENAEGATLRAFTPEDAANVAGGAFVVVVHLLGERHRRRVFLTLAAAERAARRAEDAGHRAQVLLSRIVPLGVIA
jgi:hypothetical protein